MVWRTVGKINFNLRTGKQRRGASLSKSCFLLQAWNDTVLYTVQIIWVLGGSGLHKKLAEQARE